jgi:hypothetical protein
VDQVVQEETGELIMVEVVMVVMEVMVGVVRVVVVIAAGMDK